MATTISIWQGHRSFTGDNDYKVVTFNGSEIGSVRFTGDADIQYRIFRDDNDAVIVFFVERDGYNCTAEVYTYPTLESAAEEYRFVLHKAGII